MRFCSLVSNLYGNLCVGFLYLGRIGNRGRLTGDISMDARGFLLVGVNSRLSTITSEHQIMKFGGVMGP